MQRLPVYILAGGRSSRFASDKARALFRGQPLVLHVRSLLEPIAACFTIVADQSDKYADLGLRTIADRTPGNGPLSGLEAALADDSGAEPWLLLCSCDAAVLAPAWLHDLASHAASDALAVAYRNEGASGAWEPMPALYHRSLLPRVEQQLRDGRLSMQQLLDGAMAIALPMPPDWPRHWQVNTRDDLNRLDA